MTTSGIKPTMTASMRSPRMSGCVKGGATLNSGVNRVGFNQAQRVNRREDQQELFPSLGRSSVLRREPKIHPHPDLMDIPFGKHVADPADQGVAHLRCGPSV